MKINIIEYFKETVHLFPNKIAVIDRDREITFSSLDDKVHTLAYNFASNANVLKKPIAVYLNKSIESVCADLAIIYSGNFYMNLDVKTPSERIKNIIDLITPAIIVTNNQYLKNISGILPDSIQVVNLDEVDWDLSIDEELLDIRLQKLVDTDPLCIINTSGSTGTPKGVVLNHRSFFDFTEWALDVFKFSNDEVIGSLSPLVFDIYSFELCMLMAKGNTIVVIPEHLSAFPASILQLLKINSISQK